MKDLVDSLDEIYDVGTFASIHEAQDLGDRLRILLMGYRRIRITNLAQVQDVGMQDTPAIQRAPTKQREGAGVVNERRARGRPRQQRVLQVPPDESEPPSPPKEGDEGVESPKSWEKVVMVDTENLSDNHFNFTDEVKAMTQEIVKTIRDIVNLNPLYRESVASMIHPQQRVVDNPKFLSDLAGALSSSTSAELQELLEETNIPERLLKALSVLKKELEFSKLQAKIGKEVEDKVKQQHRKYMLHEQLKVIKKELGLEKDDKDAVADKFKERLKVRRIVHVH